MAKTYSGSFMKDYLSVAVIVGGLGALLVIMPLIMCYLWISDVTSGGTPLGDIIVNVIFFVALFLMASVMSFYLLWRGTHERVTVDNMAITCNATLFTKTIPVLEIDKIVIFDKEQPIVIYDVEGDTKRMKLPFWKSNDYIDRLVADLKPLNPNIDVVDLRKSASARPGHEKAEPVAAQ